MSIFLVGQYTMLKDAKDEITQASYDNNSLVTLTAGMEYAF
ncbi:MULTISPECIES: hypothetical protein [Vibrio]|nr:MULTISPECIES: hypothetical protein [Vibrio]